MSTIPEDAAREQMFQALINSSKPSKEDETVNQSRYTRYSTIQTEKHARTRQIFSKAVPDENVRHKFQNFLPSARGIL